MLIVIKKLIVLKNFDFVNIFRFLFIYYFIYWRCKLEKLFKVDYEMNYFIFVINCFEILEREDKLEFIIIGGGRYRKY